MRLVASARKLSLTSHQSGSSAKTKMFGVAGPWRWLRSRPSPANSSDGWMGSSAQPTGYKYPPCASCFCWPTLGSLAWLNREPQRTGRRAPGASGVVKHWEAWDRQAWTCARPPMAFPHSWGTPNSIKWPAYSFKNCIRESRDGGRSLSKMLHLTAVTICNHDGRLHYDYKSRTTSVQLI